MAYIRLEARVKHSERAIIVDAVPIQRPTIRSPSVRLRYTVFASTTIEVSLTPQEARMLSAALSAEATIAAAV